MSMIDNVLDMLNEDPECRDDDGHLSLRYLCEHYDWDELDFINDCVQVSLVKTRQTLQRMYPELKGQKWEQRQKHSTAYKAKLRQQEKPEKSSIFSFFWKK